MTIIPSVLLRWRPSSPSCALSHTSFPQTAARPLSIRLVLDHGDFGVHNMSITMNASGLPLMTSLYDWETGCIVPGILSNPVMAVTVDLAANEKAAPSITRVSDDTTTDEITEYMAWATKYFEVRILFKPCLNKEVTAFRCAGSLQLSAQLRTCNSGRGRRTPHLVCIKSVER